MTIDYRGLRLIELTLEAVDRRDHYTDMSGTYFVHDSEVSRLQWNLQLWVGKKLGIYDLGLAQERTNALLDMFRFPNGDADDGDALGSDDSTPD